MTQIFFNHDSCCETWESHAEAVFIVSQINVAMGIVLSDC